MKYQTRKRIEKKRVQPIDFQVKGVYYGVMAETNPHERIERMETIIRTGVLNNINFTKKEIAEVKPFAEKGKILLNGNSFNTITDEYPSFITINPYMKLQKMKGNLSNVKAMRVKVWYTEKGLSDSCINTLKYAETMDIPVLLTYMRFISKASMKKYKAIDYIWEKSYFRPTQYMKDELRKQALHYVSEHKLYTCDSKGKGCPACMNCSKLSYGIKKAKLKSLNLSISGKVDKRGKKGLCKYNCPDCFAKKVTFGYSPACDYLTVNRKQKGL